MLSLCLTNYNRYEMLLESFQHVYDDPRITEIVISDDCSEPKIYRKLEAFCKDKPKIKLFRNEKNVGMSLNKKLAIERASNPWCTLFDSDNVLRQDYLDAIYRVYDKQSKRLILDNNCIYCPEFASPQFNYKRFAGQTISQKNVRQFINQPLFDCLLNTCNYLVNRNRYLQVYQGDRSVKASDTIHFNYLWLKSGGSFYVVPGMQYFHRVHSGSGFLADVNYNMQQAEKTKLMIMNL
jgi:glycosyltransferase involved in cell wall biosynthesis